MAILEISAVRVIMTYECGDAGCGVPLQVGPIPGENDIQTGWVGLWFGHRMVGEFPGEAEAKELGIEREVIAHMTQSAVKSHNGPADRLQSVGGACR